MGRDNQIMGAPDSSSTPHVGYQSGMVNGSNHSVFEHFKRIHDRGQSA